MQAVLLRWQQRAHYRAAHSGPSGMSSGPGLGCRRTLEGAGTELALRADCFLLSLTLSSS